MKPTHLLAGRSVLVVGDDAAVRSTLSEALREAGAVVRAVSDAAQALQAFQNAMPPFSAVVADATMAGLGGLELLARLRCAPEPPIGVLLSASPESSQVARCRAEGITVFHTRGPLVARALVRAVAEGLRSSAGVACGS